MKHAYMNQSTQNIDTNETCVDMNLYNNIGFTSQNTFEFCFI